MSEFDLESLAAELDDGDIALILAPSEKVAAVNTQIVKHYTDGGALCVYVSVSKPSATLDRQFKKAGINTENLFYIDCATSLAGNKLTRADNTIFLRPSELTNLSITMSKAIEGMPKDRGRLLLFDNLSTLMIYNDASSISRFAHAMTSRIRQWGITSIIMTLDEETDETIKSRMTQFVDKVVRID